MDINNKIPQYRANTADEDKENRPILNENKRSGRGVSIEPVKDKERRISDYQSIAREAIPRTGRKAGLPLAANNLTPIQRVASNVLNGNMDIITHNANDFPPTPVMNNNKKVPISGRRYSDYKNIFADDKRNLVNKIVTDNVLRSVDASSVKFSVNLIR